MISAFLAAGFQNNAFQVGNQPIPSEWGRTGGIEKRKHALKKNERSSIEAVISDAISRVTEPAIQTESISKIDSLKINPDIYAFDEALLRYQAEQLNRDIEEYRNFLIMAERDDEETLLLLL